MPTSLRGVVKLYDLFPIISPERGHKVYNTLKWVTLISEMDLFLRNGRNGDFFTKWSYKILI